MAVVIGLGMWLNPGSYCGPCGDFWEKKIKVENEENP